MPKLRLELGLIRANQRLLTAFFSLFSALGAGTLLADATPSDRPPSPLDFSQAKDAFELEPGLAVELVVGEPLIASPCAVAWDERGRMFVAENIGYPIGGKNGAAIGRIALLEDTDGDNRPDKRFDFATDLNFPNGLMPWRGGVIVTDAPDVLYLKDTDGDGRADVKEVLLTGFSTAQSQQLRANDPTLGPDGWVYLAGGLTGGTIYSPKNPERKLDLARTDVKFRPDTGEIKPVDGKAQFGLTFDDAGHRFVCYNRVQVQHAPLPAKYLARNPDVTSPGVLQNCPDLVRNALLGAGTDAGARIFPISANLTTADSHAGTYSAACAVHIARGDALPAEYIGQAWSCDPTGNLVRYDALSAAGGSFHAKRVRDNVEALRSRDDWFRPVFLADGPDGALYVCDMYRKTIEHPQYLPDEVRKRTDFESGKDMGRIWRIVKTDEPPEARQKSAQANLKLLADPTPANLINALRSPNGWMRDTAMRLLGSEDKAAAVQSQLEGLIADPSAPPATVVCGLNLLANAEHLTDAVLQAALGHAAADVRENAVRLAEKRLAKSPELAERVLKLAGDEAVHVRYAVALAAGDVLGADAAKQGALRDAVVDALARMSVQDAEDKWFRAAILTSLPARDGSWALLAKLNKEATASDGTRLLLADLGRLCAAGTGKEEVPRAFSKLWDACASYDFQAKAALIGGFVDRGGPPAAAELRRRVGEDPNAAAIVAEAGAMASDARAVEADRIRALSFLAAANDAKGNEIVLALVAPEQPADVAIAAARALARPRDTESVAKLLTAERWGRYSPALRSTVLTLIVGRPEFAPVLVQALETGAVPVSALTGPNRQWLEKAGDDALRARLAKLLAGDASTDRKLAFEASKAVLALKPAPVRGQRVFMNHCSSCHRLDREGYAVGPDLYGIRNQPKESILLHIVVPEQEVAPNFAAYECVLNDGRSVTGIMTAESPSSVTLRQVLGIEETFARDQIKSLTVSKGSMMPQGLEKAMKPQELADLLAYLRGEQ